MYLGNNPKILLILIIYIDYNNILSRHKDSSKARGSITTYSTPPTNLIEM